MSTGKQKTQTDPRQALRIVSAEFAAATDAANIGWMCEHIRFKIPTFSIPFGQVSRFFLTQILGCTPGERWDKCRWNVPFLYRGANCCLADEKFGHRLYIPVGVAFTPEEVLERLKSAVQVLQRGELRIWAEKQLAAGEVAIPSLTRQFDECTSSTAGPHRGR